MRNFITVLLPLFAHSCQKKTYVLHCHTCSLQMSMASFPIEASGSECCVVLALLCGVKKCCPCQKTPAVLASAHNMEA